VKNAVSSIFVVSLLLSGCATNTASTKVAYVGAKEMVTGSRVPQREPTALGVKTISQSEVSLLQITGLSSPGSPAGF
jgi:PBP1b-binding outer membrane lipoprotein LpoB